LAKVTEEAKRTPAGAAPPATTKRGKKKGDTPIDSPARWDLIMVGDDGMMLFNRGSTSWIVSPRARAEQFANVPMTVPRVANEDAEWLAACRGGPKALSSFDYAGPFTEMVLLGNLAVRLNKKIEWDGPALAAKNAPEAQPLIRREYRQGWSLPSLPAPRAG
jgi:hypothetical protein